MFDSENRLIAQFMYDHAGHLIQIRPAIDSVAPFNISYDALGRLLGNSWGHKKLSQFHYDREGRLLQWNAKKFNYNDAFRKVLFNIVQYCLMFSMFLIV